MAAVIRLLTVVELRDAHSHARQMSVSARHEAVLDDGRRLLLLDDRGWTSSLALAAANDEPEDGCGRQGPDIRATTSIEEVEATARTVVGPDEPVDGYSREHMEADHWGYLAGILQRQGLVVDGTELRRLPHDVVLGEQLLARLVRDGAAGRAGGQDPEHDAG